ncbi:SDR family oxidoreductase [Hymenobacter weizhouensis]|uniref:SDR family oxidoreductase n=1 Tax=Hymenobacter sp. YIM 151500-1 TaxID=2987689 RepID=UPI002227353B|nr:SDR family oxidoreductase [Hymenobacter sp. YIM 151500-1]UYZ63694.1 SDR family oxidoreductase [Hymenobacter sp. YIM 151500-1]
MNNELLQNATVVITGATSGIGRATAQAFARQGARLVLAARRADVLRDVAAECRRLGAPDALPVPTDTTDADAVHRLAQAAADFGRGHIDVWVNNAGSGAIGQFDATPLAAHEQVIRLNLLGYLYGAYAVLPYFRRQGRGTLINVVSLGAWVPEPYTVAYSASKFGVRGLMDTLRLELTETPDIHVCDVHPAYIDTPGFQHGANFTGRVIKPAPPVFPPQQVADAVVRLVHRPRPHTMVGWTAPAFRVLYGLAPGFTRRTAMRLFRRYLNQAQPAPITEGSLFEPRPAPHGAEVTGGWRQPEQSSSTRWLGGAALAAGLAAGLYAWGRSQASQG